MDDKELERLLAGLEPAIEQMTVMLEKLADDERMPKAMAKMACTFHREVHSELNLSNKDAAKLTAAFIKTLKSGG